MTRSQFATLPRSLAGVVKAGGKKYNFEDLYVIVKVMTRNLNKVPYRYYYPVEEARRLNLRHRPVA